MSDYILAERVAAKNALSLDQVKQLEHEGILRPVYKNGHTFYSLHDVLELRGILHLVRTRGFTLNQAAAEIAHRGALQVVTGD